MDSEVGNSSPETGVACLAMLAVDSLLGVVSALESLTDTALDDRSSMSLPGGTPEQLRAASEAACVAMVAATWHMVLPALSLLLGRAHGEVLVLKLLRVRPPHYCQTKQLMLGLEHAATRCRQPCAEEAHSQMPFMLTYCLCRIPLTHCQAALATYQRCSASDASNAHRTVWLNRATSHSPRQADCCC